MPGLTLLTICLTMGQAKDLPEDFVLPRAPGPFLAGNQNPADTTFFPAGKPLVATSYFYWYDAATKAHVLNPDGTDALTDHPPTLQGFSYKNIDWHSQELTAMLGTGIDVVLPVYWGTPLGDESWSDEGLQKLVEARERLLRQGQKPPAIGMFYDTSTLQFNRGGFRVDLTRSSGRAWFYGTIRNFFSQVPPQHRARIDGKPLIFLYAAAFARRTDEKLFPAVRAAFHRDFGTDIFLVKMVGWPGKVDSEYQWGGALQPQFFGTAALGPGYDHSAVPGRTPLVRKREDGQFYQRAWEKFLRMTPARRPWLVHVETWNEFHEGTDICHSKEHGRKYLELTRKYTDLFHAGKQLDRNPGGPGRKVVSCSPGKSEGLEIKPLPEGDGPVAEKNIQGRKAWSSAPNKYSPIVRYLYFKAEESFLFDADETVEVSVRYLDAGPKEFFVEYDSSDPTLEGLAQQFRTGPHQAIRGTGQWLETRFRLPHARFTGRANGADLRLTSPGGDLVIAEIRVQHAGE